MFIQLHIILFPADIGQLFKGQRLVEISSYPLFDNLFFCVDAMISLFIELQPLTKDAITVLCSSQHERSSLLWRAVTS